MEPLTPPWRILDAPESPTGSDAGEATQPPRPRPAPAGRWPAGLSAPDAVPQVAWLVLALALAGALVVAAFLLAGRTAGGSVDVRVAAASPASGVTGGADASGPSASGGIVVEVAGAVLRPGVYSLSPGARVGEAIAAAGGYGPRIDAARAEHELNLAAPLHDGERIRVPSRDEPSTPPSTAGLGGVAGEPTDRGLIDLNHATPAELESLPGIGPATAAKIVAARAERPFATVDALLERKVVSSRVLDGLRALVTVR